MEAADYFQIQALICRYADCLDEGDFHGAAALFAHAEFHKPDRVFKADPEGLIEYWRGWVRIYPETGTPRTRHVITNVTVAPESEGFATARSSLIIFQATPSFALQANIVVTNRDRFEKRDGGWRFVERRETGNLYGDLSAHLLKAVP
jgi:3-phenylpropionate/cinnamic acid dioxygenase small subunit